METHVCVCRPPSTCSSRASRVYLPVDALASRSAIDHDTALRRLERAGAVLTTAEAVAFEWVGDASHPQFKAISKLVESSRSA